jgi:glycosidase
VVQTGALRSKFEISELVRLVEEETAARESRDGISGVQKSTWTYDREAKAWYFHRFYDFQPDLNTSNPGSAG